MRAGLAVNVPREWLPASVRASAPMRRGDLGLAVIFPDRAIVLPDDTITYTDDRDMRLWCEESGIA
ncbi:hypothetical protein AB4879_04220 [Mycobacterium sp. SA01]